MLPRIFLITLSSLLFASCDMVEQWQEARRQDEEYAQYVRRTQGESQALTKLKQAAAECTRAQLRIMYSNSTREDVIIPLSDEELTTLRDIIPHLQDTPPLNREAWDRMQHEFRNGNMLMGICSHFIDLEFLNDKGEKIDELSLSKGLGKKEQEESYRCHFIISAPEYMLPEAERKRFYELPSVKKAETE